MATEFIPWHEELCILGRKTSSEKAKVTARHREDESATLDDLKTSRFGGRGSRCRVEPVKAAVSEKKAQTERGEKKNHNLY